METKEVCPCGEMACEELGHLSSHESRGHEPCPVQVCTNDGVLSKRCSYSLSSLNLGLLWEILVLALGLPWALVGTGAGLVPMSQIRRGPILQPWADCLASTNELFGEDSLGSH